MSDSWHPDMTRSDRNNFNDGSDKDSGQNDIFSSLVYFYIDLHVLHFLHAVLILRSQKRRPVRVNIRVNVSRPKTST